MAAAAGTPPLSKEQRFVVDYLTSNYVNGRPKNLLLFHETGTGKTRCAVACAEALITKGMRSVAVICPLAVEKQWSDEFEKFNVTNVEFIKTIFSFLNDWTGLTSDARDQLSENLILIIDESHLIRNTEILEPKRKVDVDVIKAPVFDVDADVEIIEENIESELAYKSKFMRSLIDFSDRVRARNGVILALSATPILHKPSDFSIYFRLLLNKPYDARKFTYDDAQFDARFKNMDVFKNLACGLVSYYKNVKSVATGWAPVERITVTVPLTDKQKQQFFIDRKNRGESRQKMRMRAQDTFRVYSRRWFLRNSDKMQKAIEFILEHRDKKHVVYSNFVKDGVNLFKQRFNEELNIRDARFSNPCIISSEESNLKRREACIQEFNEGKRHVILLAAAGREGIDFKGATYMHILDLPWSKADVLQIEGRVSRRGAHAPGERVFIRTYTCTSEEDSIRTSDSALFKSIVKKEEAIAPYLQALHEVSIESRVACPQLTEDVLRDKYYPSSLSAQVDLARLKSKEALDDDDPIIPAEYANVPMPDDEDVGFATARGAGTEHIRKGTTIKEYRSKYMDNLEDAAIQLSEADFIIQKQILDAKLDAVLPRMYEIAKAANSDNKRKPKEELERAGKRKKMVDEVDDLEKAVQMSKEPLVDDLEKAIQMSKQPLVDDLGKAKQMSKKPLVDDLKKAKQLSMSDDLRKAIQMSLEKMNKNHTVIEIDDDDD